MKPAVAAAGTRVLCLRIVPLSGSTVRLTDFARDLVIGANTYTSTAGYQFTGHAATAGFSPSAIDLEGIIAITGMTRARVASGAFDGARVYVFATSWAAPVEDEEPVTAGIFGAVELRDDRFRADVLSLIDTLKQATGTIYQAQCPKTFLGQDYAGCRVGVAANTVTGTLTHVTSALTFRDSTRGEAADTFGCGTFAFTTGLNAGARAIEIREHLANGTFTLAEPVYYTPSIGDAYSATRGCRKRLADCQARWNGAATFSNVANFGGDLWVPTASVYAQRGTK